METYNELDKFNPLSREYLPHKKVFLPIYKFLRRKMKINPYVSNMMTWTSSAILHGAPFLLLNKTIAGICVGSYFLSLGALDTSLKFKLKSKKKTDRLELILESSETTRQTH